MIFETPFGKGLFKHLNDRSETLTVIENIIDRQGWTGWDDTETLSRIVRALYALEYDK